MPYQPMLLGRALSPPTGESWVHEPELDGWRCIAEVNGGQGEVELRGRYVPDGPHRYSIGNSISSSRNVRIMLGRYV